MPSVDQKGPWVLESVKMPVLELFTGKHNGETVETFLNACNMYFKLTSILDENTRALFAKSRLLDTTHTCYDSQGYGETTVTFVTMKSNILYYFIPSEYVKRARRAWVACRMG